MSDTRYASIDPRRAECRHPDDGFQLPTLANIYRADTTTFETAHYGQLRISHELSVSEAEPSEPAWCQGQTYFRLKCEYPLMSPREIGALMSEAQTVLDIAFDVLICLERALDTLDVEDRLDALASAQASQDGLEGVDVVEAVGEQLITEIEEREEPETW